MTDEELIRELRRNAFVYFGEVAPMKMTVTESSHKFYIRTTQGNADVEIDNETLENNQEDIVDRILNLLRVAREEEITNGNQ